MRFQIRERTFQKPFEVDHMGYDGHHVFMDFGPGERFMEEPAKFRALYEPADDEAATWWNRVFGLEYPLTEAEKRLARLKELCTYARDVKRRSQDACQYSDGYYYHGGYLAGMVAVLGFLDGTDSNLEAVAASYFLPQPTIPKEPKSPCTGKLDRIRSFLGGQRITQSTPGSEQP